MTDSMGVAATLHLLWAKTDRQGLGVYHPLQCHLTDVASVARAMWRGVFTDCLRRFVEDATGLSGDEAETWLCFWAGAPHVHSGNTTTARSSGILFWGILRSSLDLRGANGYNAGRATAVE